jgi:uncharacterized protein (DUF342 family)
MSEFELFQQQNKKNKIMYYVQYFSPITLTWQEVRKTYKTKKEAENVAFSYGDTKVRVVEYINGIRNYSTVDKLA